MMNGHDNADMDKICQHTVNPKKNIGYCSIRVSDKDTA